MRSAALFSGLLLFAFSAVAQQAGSAAPPFEAKRLPPEKAQSAEVPDLTPQLAAIQNALSVTEGTSNNPPSANVPPPAGYKPKADVALTPTAKDAVQMSEKWMAEQNQPLAGQDGRVVYSYGAGLPTVVCAPLRVCIIELQAGEKLAGEPHIGDSVRWNVSPAMFGHDDSATTLIVLKPQIAGLDTNLLITTDRRAYYLRLLSKPEDYVARVAFSYPSDGSARKKWEMSSPRPKPDAPKDAIAELPRNAVESLCFDYRIKGKADALKPIRVFDDGQKTFIQIRHETQTRQAPVLVVLGRDGKQEMVNYRLKGDMYIVDRLFERAELILGTGKKAEKVEIERERKS
jgi:type IV secretion system protein VirB9